MRGSIMLKLSNLRPAKGLFLMILLSLGPAFVSAQSSSQVMGEVRFNGDTQLDRDSGVWIDGNYVGYVKELKGNKKVLLLPGKHQIVVRQAGYTEFTRELIIEPGQIQEVQVSM